MQTRQQLDNFVVIFSSPEGERNPGVKPTKYRALVLVDKVHEKTEGGLIIPPSTIEKARNGQTEGEFISAGGKAFSDWNPEEIPQPGKRVVFERYAGQYLTGEDGLEYRLMNDDQIVGVRE